MDLGVRWKLLRGRQDPAAGRGGRPGRTAVLAATIGIGAQHVVAMFGATFVFPLDHGPGPQPRDHDVRRRDDPLPADRARARSPATWAPAPRSSAGGRHPGAGRQLGATSPARSWSPASCSPLVGVLIHFVGARVLHTVLPPVVTGAVVMLIGFNLAPGRRRHLLAAGPVGRAGSRWCSPSSRRWRLRGFWSRIAIFLGAGLRLRCSPGCSTRSSARSTAPTRRRRGHHPLPARPRRRVGRRLVRPARPSHAPALPAELHPAGAAGRHRADRREHRARQGCRAR